MLKIFSPPLIFLLGFVASISSFAQLEIIKDTLSFDCLEVNKVAQDRFIVTSQEQYESLEFVWESDNGCLPFSDFEKIDFTRYMLVGYKFLGSHCDKDLISVNIVKEASTYTLQFSTFPNHTCSDSEWKIAWFILEKPKGDFGFRCERISH